MHSYILWVFDNQHSVEGDKTHFISKIVGTSLQMGTGLLLRGRWLFYKSYIGHQASLLSSN